MSIRTLTFVALTIAVTRPAGADPQQTAQQFLRQTTHDARRALFNTPGARPALTALGEVLERGAVDRGTLRKVVSNPHAKPYLINTLRALKEVDSVRGVNDVLGRMAKAGDDGSASGPAFEISAGAAIKRNAQAFGARLQALGINIGPHEVDALLSDGTRVEIKYFRNSGSKEMIEKRASRAIGKAKSQLAKRCSGNHPAMLIIPTDQSQPGAYQSMANAIGSKLTVVAVDPSSCNATKVFCQAPARVSKPLRRGRANSALGQRLSNTMSRKTAGVSLFRKHRRRPRARLGGRR